MNTSVLLILLFLFANIPANSQWIEQTSPTTQPLYSVSVVDNNVAWACGRAGTIIRTTNGGADWSIIAPGYFQSYQHFWSMYALDAQTAWVAYHQLSGIGDETAVYKTTDGGSNWTTVFYQTGGVVTDIEMFTPDYGFLYTSPLNEYWRFFNTTDGGTSWQLIKEYLQSIFLEQSHYNSTFVSNADIWFGSNSNNLYHSDDYGYSWNTVPIALTNTYSIWFNDANDGLAAGDFNLEKTTDGGNSWFQGTGAPSLDSNSSIYGENNLWWVANLNHIYYSDDNRITWSTQYSAPSGRYFQISKARNGNLILAVRGNGGISAYSAPIPVELLSFTAETDEGNIHLYWKTASETNNMGFEIERKRVEDKAAGWKKIDFLDGMGTTTEENSYSYNDVSLKAGIYSYRLTQIDFDGTKTKAGEVNVVVRPQINEYSLIQNYPNPFNPSTRIEYLIPMDGFVNITVFNAVGEEVKQLINGNKTAGRYEVQFDATGLSSGSYFYRIKSGSYTDIKKMILLR